MGDSAEGLRNGKRASRGMVARTVMLVKRYYTVVLDSNDARSTFEWKFRIWFRFGTGATIRHRYEKVGANSKESPALKKRGWSTPNRSLGLRPGHPLARQGYTERMSQSDLVVVESYATEGEAEVAKGVLESSGIDAMVQADTAGRMREHLAWSGVGHRVLVREEDAAAARGLLALPQNDDLELLQNATENQVEILQGALLSADIFATVRYDGTYYQLLVNKEDVATARQVLERLSKARA
jgi:hypothetical protein